MPSLADAVALRLAPHFAGLLERHGVEALVRRRGSAEEAVGFLGEKLPPLARAFEIACRHAGNAEWDRLVVRFACDIGAFFNLRGRYGERIAWAEAGMAAARRLGDAAAESVLVTGIGNVALRTGRFDQALVHYRRAYELSAAVGNEPDMAVDPGNMGLVHDARGEFEESERYFRESLRIRERLGDEVGVARMRMALGDIRSQVDDLDGARDEYEASLRVLETANDPVTHSRLLTNLGSLAHKRGLHAEAVVIYERSLEIKEQLGDELGRAIVLGNLANPLAELGRIEEAIASSRAAVAIAVELDDARTLAHHGWTLGRLLDEHGHAAEAVPYVEQSVRWCEAVGHPELAERRTLLDDLRTRVPEA